MANKYEIKNKMDDIQKEMDSLSFMTPSEITKKIELLKQFEKLRKEYESL